MANGFHTRTTLRDFGRKDRDLFLKRGFWNWIRKWMGRGK